MATWKDYGKKMEPAIESDNLTTWLTMSVDDRCSMSLALLDCMMKIADKMGVNDCYIQIGTTQNKSSFVFAVKGGDYDDKKLTSYDKSFIGCLAQVALASDQEEMGGTF